MTENRDDAPEPGSLAVTPDAGAAASADQIGSIADSFEFLESRELRAGETDDPYEAAEEGLTWIPPIDPPTAGVEDDGDPRIAAGFGTTALDEPYDDSHRAEGLPAEDEVTARVREALLADASTTAYADRVGIDVSGTTVVLNGTVEDLDDEDALVAVAATVEGVADVRSEIAVEGI